MGVMCTFSCFQESFRKRLIRTHFFFFLRRVQTAPKQTGAIRLFIWFHHRIIFFPCLVEAACPRYKCLQSTGHQLSERFKGFIQDTTKAQRTITQQLSTILQRRHNPPIGKVHPFIWSSQTPPQIIRFYFCFQTFCTKW